MMYILSWQTVYALTRVLLLCLFPSLLRNSGNKHTNNPLVSAETVRHTSAYTILYENIEDPPYIALSSGLWLILWEYLGKMKKKKP